MPLEVGVYRVRVVVVGCCYWTSCRRAGASLAVTGEGPFLDKQLDLTDYAYPPQLDNFEKSPNGAAGALAAGRSS